MHFVFNCICAAIFCLTTSSLSARSSAASYSSRAAVFHRTTSSHSAAVFSSAVSFAIALMHPRVEFWDIASHSFQFGFAHAAFPFYSSSYLQQFGFFFILSNTVFLIIQFSLQAYVLQFSQKMLYFFSKKKRSWKTVSGLILQSQR